MGVPLVFDTSTGITTARPFIASDNVFASGVISSGVIASGAVQGFFGSTRNIASGTLGVFDFGSGAVIAGTVGSGAIVSGNIASGQVGNFAISSGAVTSGRLGVTGTPDGTKFLRDDFTWSSPIISGSIQSGMIASGAVQGFFGSTRNIASGTVGVFDFGSGAVIAGTVGSGAIVSGNIASGQIGQFHLASGSVTSGAISSGVVGQFALSSGSVTSGAISSGQISTYHLASGATVTRAQFVAPFVSGTSWTVITEEIISGVRAVAISQSGNLRVAMASVSGRGPAIGIVVDNVLSGIQANVYTVGPLQFTSGLGDYSGYIGQPLYVGRSGQIVTSSGSFNSGGLLSGDVVQQIGFAWTSGGALIEVNAPFVSGGAPALTSGIVQSGNIASGAVQGFFGSTRNIASGTVGVFDFGSGAVIAGTVGSGAIVSGNIASGQVGQFHLSSGSVTSGAISSGVVGQFALSSGSVTSGAIASGQVGQFAHSSGAINSGHVSSGAVQGFFGSTRHIASGTVGVFDFGSGAVIAGTVGSGAIVSGNIASGQVGQFHLSSGSVTSGAISSGVVGQFALSSGSVTSGAISSGQVNTYHLGSGATVTRAQFVAPFVSGTSWTVITEEIISGVRAVALSQSGNLRVAMASVSGRYPAVGVVVDNVLSGIQANVYTVGPLQFTSGLGDYSGYIGQPLYVGRSGQVVTSSGSFNSGGLLSGDAVQQIGFAWTSGGALIEVNAPFVSGGTPSLTSGIVQSGNIGSGAVQGFFGSTRNIASGTVGVFDFGSGAVIAGTVGSGAIVSGNIASGQIGQFHLSSGSVTSGAISSGVVGQFALSSGSVTSGAIASGQVGQFALSSGSVTSGAIASGQVGQFALSSGSVTSGAIASGQVGQFAHSSGAINSGHVSSGAVQGFFGSTRNIASGTVGVFDFGSGAVIAGTVGSGAIVSGNIASGQVGQFHLSSGSVTSGAISSGVVGQFALSSGSVTSGAISSGQVNTYHFGSGATVTRAQFVAPFVSGTSWTVITEEIISGVRAVMLSQSGNLRISMASVSGRSNAIGIVVDNVLSGIQANVYAIGPLQFTSGLGDYSGYIGQPLYVGRSGQIVTSSGSFNSGGFLSGDVTQQVGMVWTSGGALIEIDAPAISGGVPALTSGLVQSGNIASGAVQGFFGSTRNIASGTVGVFDFGSGAVIAGTVGSGAIVSGNIASGQIGQFHLSSGSVTSGAISSGVVGQFALSSGSVTSGAISSGVVGQFALSSGAVNSGHVSSGAVQGFFGSTRHIASGTVGVFDFGSGAVIAGTVGSGAIVSGNIASGQVGQFHLASGSVTSGAISSGVVGQFALSSGSVTSGAISSGQVSTYHFASGATVTRAQYVVPFLSGTGRAVTEELISGVRAVALSQSGNLRIAMASISGRGPAIGVVVDNVVSGSQATVYTVGPLQFPVGDADYSGYLGQPLYVGRSGQIVTSSGSFNSGGLLSGDAVQQIGYAWTSGGALIEVNAPFVSGGTPSLTSGLVQSGNIGSGAVQGFFGSTRNIASGTVGVFDFGSGAVIAGTVGSGAIVSGNIASGQVGQFHLSSGSVTSGAISSGVVGQFALSSGSVTSGAISSGVVGQFALSSGSVTSGAIASGQVGQFAHSSGAINSGHVSSGAVQGFFGSTRHIASGTVGVFDFGSGAVIAGTVGSGAIVSGNVASGQLSTFHFASGAKIDSAEWLIDDTFVTNELISGGKAVAFNQSGQLVIAMAGVASRMPAVGILPANVASGSVATIYREGRLFNTIFNFSGWTGSEVFVGQSGDVVASGNPTSSGAVQQILGMSIAGSGIMIQIGDPFLDTVIQSGSVGSGAIQGYFGSTPNIASGTVGVFDFGSGAVIAGTVGSGAIVSGNIASGQVGQFAISSGAVTSGRLGTTGTPDGTKFLRDDFTWTAPSATVTSGGIQSGMIASGAVQGFFGSTRHIASGTVGVFDFGSGAVIAGAVGSGAIVSGNIGSGQVGNFAISSGAVTSGRLGVTGTPDGTKFLRDDFTWTAATAVVGSGGIQSGMIASGAVQGFFGSTRHIASGTIGVFDFGSGAVIAGAVGSGAIVSGNVASGQLSTFHFASGAKIDSAEWLIDDTFVTNELISGGKAVAFNQSGQLVIAMAGVSGRMPAVGVLPTNVASGSVATIYREGRLFNTIFNFSGWTGNSIYVGQSGDVVASGSPTNSGVTQQILGVAIAGSGIMIQIGDPFKNGIVSSGSIGSGAVQGFFGTTRNIASGTIGVFDFGSGAVIAGTVGSGAIVSGNIASGQIGQFHLASGSVTSGAISSGVVGQFALSSGSVTSGAIASGQVGQFAHSSGAINSGHVSSGAVQGFFGSTRHIASGTIGVFDFGSGAVIAGTVGSGAIVSGNIGSGQVGNFAISSGAVTSGRLGVTGTPDGTKFLRDDFTWSAPSATVTSGGIQSGMIASGAVQGFFGSTRHIASGTIGVFDFGSGAVIAGAVGSGAIVSGNVASGQLSTFHFASGAKIDSAEWLIDDTFVTNELISGGKAVAFNQSGQLVIAMAGVPSRMPAVGILPTNVVSGTAATIYRNGRLFNTIFNFSGWTGQSVFVGQSGDVVASGSPTNSGAVQQVLGESIAGSGIMIQLGDPFLDATILSGQIGSGAVGAIHIASGQVGNNQVASGFMPNPGYLYGLGLTWVSSGQIIVGSGVAMDSTGYTNIWIPTRTTVNISGTGNGPASMDISPIGNVSVTTSGLFVSGSNMFLLWPMRTGTGLLAFSGTAGIVGSGGDLLNQVAVGDLIGTSGQSFWRVTAVNSGTFTTAISGSLTSGSKVQIIENAFFSTSGQISCVVNNILSGINLTLGGVPKVSGSTIPGFIGGAPNNVTSGFQSYLMAWVSQGQSGNTTFLSTQRTTPLVSGIVGYQTYFRRIGSVIYNGFSGQIVPFDQWGDTGYGKYTQFEVANHTNNTVIFSGTLSGLAAVWAGLDCSRVAPPTATAIRFNAINTSPTSGGAIYFRKRGAGESTGTRNLRSMGAFSGVITSYVFDCPCDGVQSIENAWPISGLQLQLDVIGYFETQF